MLGQLAAHEVADARPAEGAEHLDDAAAQQKGEAAAHQRRRKTQRHRGVKTVDALDLIQMRVKLFPGHELALPVKIVDEMFQPVQPGGVHPCVGQTQRLGVALVAVKAGELDGQQADQGRAVGKTPAGQEDRRDRLGRFSAQPISVSTFGAGSAILKLNKTYKNRRFSL